MAQVTVEVDPGEVGFDAGRLTRIDEHFARYVEDGRLPGWQIVVTRHGRVVHASCHGHRDVEAGLPIEPDTVYRIYSMTKPITSVAAMMLYEEARFDLKDTVRRHIPAFRDTRVYRSGSFLSPVLEPQVEPMRIWHLLTHTAGLTYGFHYSHPVDQLYRNAGFDLTPHPELTLADFCDQIAALPLVHQPGASWNYSVATDVLGRVVEVVSGMSLDEFFRTRIFEPLGMTDTAFWADAEQADRLAALYLPEPGTRRAVPTKMGRAAAKETAFLSGGGGLVSTAHDYHRFTQMLRNGGELDGVRLLSPRTVAYMASNHLPGGVDLEAFGQSTFAETTFDGVGFGLGFSVTQDPVANKVLGSVGEYGWGGAASTAFWVDPVEDLTALFFTQLLPSSTHPIRPQLKQLVYQALVD